MKQAEKEQNYQRILDIGNTEGFFSSFAGAHFTSVSDTDAEAYITVGKEQCNPYGIVHGGVYYTVMDQLTGMCLAATGMGGVTIDSSISYLKSAKMGDKVICKAHCLHFGRSVAVYEAKCFGEDGTLQCSGVYHFLVKGPLADVVKVR